MDGPLSRKTLAHAEKDEVIIYNDGSLGIIYLRVSSRSFFEVKIDLEGLKG